MPTPPEAFVREAQADIDALTAGLVDLDRQDGDTLDEVFRTAHTLKSNCGLVGLEDARELAHALEDVLQAVRSGRLQPDESVIEETLAAADDLDLIITAAATGADHAVDHEQRATSLRELVATHAEEGQGTLTDETGSGSPDADVADERGPQATNSQKDDTDGAEWDPDVAAALEEASIYDDLEGLAADVDVPAEDSLEDWGSLADLDNQDEADHSEDTAAAADSSTAPQSPGDQETDRDAADPSEDVIDDPPTFDQLKEDVGRDSNIDRLQADIEEAEFGEFDDEDDLTIDELIDVPPAGQVESEAEDVGADWTPADPDSDSESGGDADASTSPHTGTGDTSFSEVREEVSQDDDLERLESDIEEAEFGEFDDEDELSITELVDADPADLDPDRPQAEGSAEDSSIGTQGSSDSDADSEAGEPSSPGTDDPVSAEVAAPTESETDHEDTTPPAPSSNDGSDESAPADDSPADVDTVAASSTDETPDSGSDPGASSVTSDQDDDTDPFGVETEAHETTEDSAGETALGDPFDVAGDGDDDGSVGQIPEVGDALFPDADSEPAESEAPADKIDVDIDFGGDSGLESFESRFGELFDEGTTAADQSPGYHQPVETIQASAFDETQLATTDPSGEQRRTERSDSVTVAPETADALLNYIEQLSTGHRRLERELDETDASVADIISNLRTATAGLRETVRQVRLTPLSTVAERLPRAARRAARDTDKQVSVELSGTDITLDRGVVDRLGDPLTHLVRNAVAHGIEPSDEREAAGKPATGTVELRAEHEGDRVMIEVEDDGRGLDLDAIAEAAAEEGLLDAEDTDSLTAEQAADLVCRPGLSTATEVSETSGRGVGMDVAVQAVTELNGDLEVETESGEGTLVRLRVPVSVAVTEVLFVEVGDRLFAVPASVVEQVGVPTQVETEEGTEYVTVDPIGDAPELERLSGGGLGSVDDTAEKSESATSDRLPMLRLGEAFDLPVSTDTEGAVIQLRSEARQGAILCDRVLELREVVITPYERVLGGTPGVSGVTTHGDGELVNVLDVTTL